MLYICKQRAKQDGFAAYCHFHEDYLDSLSSIELHGAAICILVSQFILDQLERSGFFLELSRNFKQDGILASSDLASEVESAEYEILLHAWMNMIMSLDVPLEGRERMLKPYANDVGVRRAG